MLLMSSFPAGISNAFGAGKNLLPGKLFESVQAGQNRTNVDRQKCGKVNAESDFESENARHAEESQATSLPTAIYTL